MTTVLVADDESPMRRLLRIYLENAGLRVEEADSGDAVLTRLRRPGVDLLILDLMMPRTDGWQTCAEARMLIPDLPILILSARSDVVDRVTGLNIGADDYLTKPFDGRELVARAQALLRRAKPEEGAAAFPGLGLVVDGMGHKVTVKGQIVSLTPKEFDLLDLLTRHVGRSFTREELLDRVWGMDFEGGTRTVDSHVKNIREKLRAAGAGGELIVTVWGVGYRFEEQS
ncbi:DNA-binding response regulator [Alicyclobacillaceae bacterium I2511]|nr:DNA-binding response regulator [Alicyclobacillaceae bacterium I2511]